MIGFYFLGLFGTDGEKGRREESRVEEKVVGIY
jgi:hypothetical protein